MHPSSTRWAASTRRASRSASRWSRRPRSGWSGTRRPRYRGTWRRGRPRLRSGRAQRTRQAAPSLWLLAVLTSASQKPLQFAEQRLAIRRDTAAIQTENLKRFLATGDRSALEGKPIPYPSPDRLIAITSDPAIRAILPPHLLGQTGQWRTRDRFLRYGPLLIPFGLMLFMLALLAARPRERPTYLSESD